MSIGRSDTVALPLPDGSVLVAAGYSGYHDLASSEVFSLGGTLNSVANAGFESGPGIAWSERSNDHRALVTRDLPHTSEFGARLGGMGWRRGCRRTGRDRPFEWRPALLVA